MAEEWAGIPDFNTMTLTRDKLLWAFSSGDHLSTVVQGGTNHKLATGYWPTKARQFKKASIFECWLWEEYVTIQCFAPCCKWGSVATDQTEHPCQPVSTIKNTYSWHVSELKQWRKITRSKNITLTFTSVEGSFSAFILESSFRRLCGRTGQCTEGSEHSRECHSDTSPT